MVALDITQCISSLSIGECSTAQPPHPSSQVTNTSGIASLPGLYVRGPVNTSIILMVRAGSGAPILHPICDDGVLTSSLGISSCVAAQAVGPDSKVCYSETTAVKVVDPAVSVSVVFPSTSNDTLFCPDASSGLAAAVSTRACARGGYSNDLCASGGNSP